MAAHTNSMLILMATHELADSAVFYYLKLQKDRVAAAMHYFAAG